MFGFLDRDVDARAYAAGRILVGLGSVGVMYEWQFVMRRAASGEYLQMPAFGWVPGVGEPVVYALVAVALAAAGGMVLGIWPRVAAGLLGGVTAAVLLLEQQTYSNHLVLLGCLSVLLAMSGSDHAWTLVGRRPGRWVPFWPGFLIMALVSGVYFWTALAKINPQFLRGDVLATSLRAGIPVPASLMPVLAVVVICTEMSLAIGLWIRPLRPMVFAVGAALHVSIVLMLVNPFPLVPFAMMMAAGYVLFWVEAIDTRLRPHRQPTVLSQS